MNDTTQAVVETDAPAKPGAQVDSARVETDELDKLLAEFDSDKPKPPETPKPEPKGTDDVKSLLEPLQGQLTQLQNRQFKHDMGDTIKKVRGDLDPDFFDDKLVKGWIDAMAEDTPKLATAWVNRDNNPKAFQKVVEQLGRDFSKKFSKLPDKSATEDREAVSHAVRGASTNAPEGKAPDFSGMSNAEYREKHKAAYGYYPNV